MPARPAPFVVFFFVFFFVLAGCTYYVDPEDQSAAAPATTTGADATDGAAGAGADGSASGASLVSVELVLDGVPLKLSTRTDDAVGWLEATYTAPADRASTEACGHGEAIFEAGGAVVRRVAFPAGVPVPGQTASASERRFDLLFDALEELAREPDSTALSMRLCGVTGALAFDAASRSALRELVSTLRRLRNEPEPDPGAPRIVRGYAARAVEPAATGYYQAEARFVSPAWAVSVALASPTAGLADRVTVTVELVGTIPRRCNGELTAVSDGNAATIAAASHEGDAQSGRHVYRYATSVESLMAMGAATEVKLAACYGDATLDPAQRATLAALVTELARIDGGR